MASIFICGSPCGEMGKGKEGMLSQSYISSQSTFSSTAGEVEGGEKGEKRHRPLQPDYILEEKGKGGKISRRSRSSSRNIKAAASWRHIDQLPFHSSSFPPRKRKGQKRGEEEGEKRAPEIAWSSGSLASQKKPRTIKEGRKKGGRETSPRLFLSTFSQTPTGEREGGRKERG